MWFVCFFKKCSCCEFPPEGLMERLEYQYFKQHLDILYCLPQCFVELSRLPFTLPSFALTPPLPLFTFTCSFHYLHLPLCDAIRRTNMTGDVVTHATNPRRRKEQQVWRCDIEVFLKKAKTNALQGKKINKIYTCSLFSIHKTKMENI